MATRDPAKIRAHKERNRENRKTPRFMSPTMQQEREQLAGKAVTLLQRFGITDVYKEDFGLRGGVDEQAWSIVLVDLHRYLLVVRDERAQRIVLARRTAAEVQRTIETLGVAEDGWPITEQAEMVVDLVEETCFQVRSAVS